MINLRAEAVYLIDSRNKKACLLYTSKLWTNNLTIHEMEAAYTNQQTVLIHMLRCKQGQNTKPMGRYSSHYDQPIAAREILYLRMRSAGGG
jgi:hypothetical protein